MAGKTIAFLLALALSLSCSAQSVIVTTAGTLIQNNRFDAANHYLDSILKKDKKNVDALMMKGNVLLNKKWTELPTPVALTTNNESVFDTAVANLDVVPPIIPAETVKQVEAYWKKCTKLKPERTDIQKGLCNLYALALDEQKLKLQIPVLLRLLNDTTGEQAYNVAEYARRIKERGQFDKAMSVYQYIAHLYPELAGIRADIGSEYFYAGKFKECFNWLDSALQKKDVDETTYLNTAFIYSQMGYYDNCQMVLERYDREYKRSLAPFYKALRLFADGDMAYRAKLKSFAQQTDSNSYYQEHQLASALVALGDTITKAEFDALVNGGYQNWYMPLVLERAVKEKVCGATTVFGIYQSSIKNYSAATQFLDDDDGCKITEAEYRFLQLHSAYANYMAGDNTNAEKNLSPLEKNSSAFYRHAAFYFEAKISLAKNEKLNALRLLKLIVTDKEVTKYAYLATALQQRYGLTD
ncbi:MAG: hypothetical protein U0V74_00435 [Chitinophagales bacterium]